MTAETVRDPVEVLAELLSPEGKLDPYALYDELWAHGPVIDLGGHLVVLGFDECSQALREPRLLSMDAAVQDLLRPGWRDHPAWRGLTTIMLFRNAPDHERLRRTFSPYLTSSAVATLRPMVERLARAGVERLAGLVAGGRVVDLLDELAFRFPMDVLGELLGIPEADRPAYRGPIGAVAATYEPTTQLDDLGPSDAGMDDMWRWLAGLVADRRAAPTGDLTSRLLADQHAGAEISDDELVANLMLLVVGGVEAPMDLLAKLVRLAVERPEHRETLRRGDRGDRGAMARVVEETLRWDPPVHALLRMAGENVVLPGLTVPAGTRLTLVVGAAHRDPRRFHEPHRFDPQRVDLQHLTLGAGGHFCLGAHLARLMAGVLLPTLLRRLPDLRLAGPPTFRDTIVQHGFATFPVTA